MGKYAVLGTNGWTYHKTLSAARKRAQTVANATGGMVEVNYVSTKGVPMRDATAADRIYPKRTGNPRKGNRGRNPSGSVDYPLARELSIFANNSKWIDAFWKNATIKKAQGKYDSTKAVKLFRYAADRAWKEYKREYGDIDASTATRNQAAIELVKDFEYAFNDGRFNEYIPKKYRAKNPGLAGYQWAVNRGGKQLGLVYMVGPGSYSGEVFIPGRSHKTTINGYKNSEQSAAKAVVALYNKLAK